MNVNVSDLIGGEKWRDLSEVKIDGTVFYRNTKVRNFLNKVLHAKFKAVFTQYKKYDLSKNNLNYSGEWLYIVTESGHIAALSNSEWAFITEIKDSK